MHSINLQLNVMKDLNCDSTAVFGRLHVVNALRGFHQFAPAQCVLELVSTLYTVWDTCLSANTLVLESVTLPAIADCKVRSLTCDALIIILDLYGKNTVRKDILSHRIYNSMYVQLSPVRSRQHNLITGFNFARSSLNINGLHAQHWADSRVVTHLFCFM